MYGYGWKPYVSVGKRRAQAKRYAAQLKKQGRKLLPVEISGRKIATTFWGTAWCDNLESYSDFANRLPRGRTYVRNGSVIDLQISPGRVTGLVSGSEIYEVEVEIEALGKSAWKAITKDCSQAIDSLIDLLQGRFARGVMERLTRQDRGLFPKPKEIAIDCSCPDWAGLCKHAAAVLYGVGARLDCDPEMLFRLRDVDHVDLIGQAVDGAHLDAALAGDHTGSLDHDDLGELFGIDIEAGGVESQTKASGSRSIKKNRRNSKKTTTRTTTATKKRASKKQEAVEKPPKQVVAKKKSAKKKAAKTKSPKKKPAKKQAPK